MVSRCSTGASLAAPGQYPSEARGRPETGGRARLVRLDGTEVFLPGRSVRYSGQTHVMVAVGSPVEYFWLRKDDVTDAE